MAIDIQYLLSPDGEPATPDQKAGAPSLPPSLQITGDGSIRVTEAHNQVLLSTAIPIPQVDQPDETVPDDPLQYMSYRARLVKNGDDVQVIIQTSYLDCVRWESGAWLHEEVEIPSRGFPVTGYPTYLYLKVPVKFFSGQDSGIAGTDYPSDLFESNAFTVHGESHTAEVVTTTGYIGRDTSVSLNDYFLVTTTQQSSAPLDIIPGTSDRRGTWYFLFATISETAGVQQIHLGSRTLPQPMTMNLASFTIT